MDENLNPTPENNNENAETEPLTENGTANEFEDFLKQSENKDAESESVPETQALNDDGDNTERKTKKSKDKKEEKKKSKGFVAAIVLIVVLLAAATGLLVYFIVSSSNSSKLDLEKTAVTVGDVENSVGEYLQVYSYYYQYAYYYGYTEDQVKELSLQQIVFIDTLYSEALANGYTLSEEDNAEIDANLESVRTEAEASSMTMEEYLESSVCKGYTVDMLRSYIEKQYLAQMYYNDNMEDIEAQFTGSDAAAQIEAEYSANKTTYDLSDASYWYFDSSEDGADAKADSLVSAAASGTFSEAVKSVAGDDSEPYSLSGYTLELISSDFSQDAAEWLFETTSDGSYANAKGACTKIASDNGVIYVIYVNEAPSRDESLPATVDYIRVDVSTDTSVKTADEQKLAAKTTANKILAEFNETDKTQFSFEEILGNYDNGDDELISGDVYEDMTMSGSQADAVKDWAFDASRSVGDCEVVEGADCYYVLYYVSRDDTAVWYSSVLNSLITVKQTEWQDGINALSEGKVTTDDEAIAQVAEYIASLSQSS